ncbi:hypothetical protein DH2020_001174 [Rehmannia glutinosa]|uniref:Defensin-like protein n=1 Tax=Rehmannia glutinosa TaxID=99300 RepID=A0ABR0XZ17_REHGL
MESKKDTFSIKSSLLIALFCMALLTASVLVAGEDVWVYQGPCSQFPDCNKHCVEIGYRQLGGKCVPLKREKGSPLVCVCLVHS